MKYLNFIVLWVGLGLVAGTATAQGLRALSQVDTEKSYYSDRLFGDLEINLALNQPVPFRIFTLANPNRVIMDFREIAWNSQDAQAVSKSDRIGDVRFGIFQPGWSRLVLPLSEPMLVRSAEMKVDNSLGTGTLQVLLKSTDQDTFSASSGEPDVKGWGMPVVDFPIAPKTRQIGDRPIIIAIDPGHGGVDPGAVVDKYTEKELVLKFARELKDALIRTGRFEAYLTRDDDVFLSLTGRISEARKKRADVLLSLHADALADSTVSGITVYTLSSKASSEAADQLATQLDRADLLAGVDLTRQDDVVASVLMDLARVETNARSNALAGDIVDGIANSVNQSRKRPQLSAAFTVLKAPDIPSVLIELGFMTNKKDLRNLLNPVWRDSIVEGITNGLQAWSVEDAAQARLLRK